MGASQLQTYLTNTKGSHHPGCSENRDKQKRFQSTSSTLHLQLIKYIKLFQLLLLLLWCESLCASQLSCALISLNWFSIQLCFSLFYSLPLCSVRFLLHTINSWTSHCGPNQPNSAAPQPRLIAVDSLLTSLLLSWKKGYVCSWLFSFYLYFKPHTRCRVGLELVTWAHSCIIHEEELLAAAAK